MFCICEVLYKEATKNSFIGTDKAKNYAPPEGYPTHEHDKAYWESEKINIMRDVLLPSVVGDSKDKLKTI